MRIGVTEFPPFLFAGIRQVAAGILLCSFLLIIKKIEFPSYPNLAKQALAGFLMIAMGNGLVTWAEVYVPSGVAAIICSFMPVWMVLINLTINRSELPNPLIVLGVLTGDTSARFVRVRAAGRARDRIMAAARCHRSGKSGSDGPTRQTAAAR